MMPRVAPAAAEMCLKSLAKSMAWLARVERKTTYGRGAKRSWTLSLPHS